MRLNAEERERCERAMLYSYQPAPGRHALEILGLKG